MKKYYRWSNDETNRAWIYFEPDEIILGWLECGAYSYEVKQPNNAHKWAKELKDWFYYEVDTHKDDCHDCVEDWILSNAANFLDKVNWQEIAEMVIKLHPNIIK